MLHQILNVSMLVCLILSIIGLLLFITTLIFPKFKHRDAIMYFSIRTIVGSTLIAFVILMLLKNLN